MQPPEALIGARVHKNLIVERSGAQPEMLVLTVENGPTVCAAPTNKRLSAFVFTEHQGNHELVVETTMLVANILHGFNTT